MKLSDRRSIVAIDPTTRGIAFVFFENGEVMDWGERLRSRKEGNDLAVVDQVLDGCAASVLVLEDPDANRCRRRARIRSLLRSIAKHARRRGFRVRTISREDVRRQWLSSGVTRKDAIAVEIARRFSELSGVVPPRRKTSANEDPRINVFDAASLAIHACDRPPFLP